MIAFQIIFRLKMNQNIFIFKIYFWYQHTSKWSKNTKELIENKKKSYFHKKYVEPHTETNTLW